jgi:aminopeptidase N
VGIRAEHAAWQGVEEDPTRRGTGRKLVGSRSPTQEIPMKTLALVCMLALSINGLGTPALAQRGGRLGLTPEQRAAVRAEVQRAAPELKALRARARQLIQAARAQGKPSPESRRALRDSLRGLRDEARRDLLPSARQLLGSLTPEQRARIAAAAKARGLNLTEAQLEERTAARLQRRLAQHHRHAAHPDARGAAERRARPSNNELAGLSGPTLAHAARCAMLWAMPLALLLVALQAPDLRAAYDVLTYRLDLTLEPESQTLSGTLALEALVSAPELSVLQLDLQGGFVIAGARELTAELTPRGELAGAALVVTRIPNGLTLALPKARKQGEHVRVALSYSGHPGEHDEFEGVHWKRTQDGRPWFSVACQGVGSSWWWPGKDSFWHPEDKPERTFVNASVPKGLYAVANGRLTGREEHGAQETFHWVHEYPCETYAITLDVAPYVVVEQQLELPGQKEPLLFAYYVLPESREKAALQFQDVPRMLEVYARAFGPFPFPKSKYALVETSFWGMEHSTAVAYGSSYPKWCQAHGAPDRYAGMNRAFDYILVHESAHEWWGNAVSAKNWGHFWLHEGFGTYAESVYLEFTQGRAAADAYFEAARGQVGARSCLYRGADKNSEQAYSNVIYTKGAWVLNTLRHCVADDAAWWKTLQDFNLEFRYGNAVTEDFRAVLERNTQRSWKEFFDEWFYGSGFPRLKGSIRSTPQGIVLAIENQGSDKTGFHVPLDLSWKDATGSVTRRIWLEPGTNQQTIALAAQPRELSVMGPQRILGKHELKVE